MLDTSNDRKVLNWRKSYESKNLGYSERFIVPILEERIQFLLHQFMETDFPNSAVLDIGCGGQPLRQTLEKMNYIYLGLDTQQNSDNSVDFVVPIDSETLPSELSSYDIKAIISTEVMEHVVDWDSAFRNMSYVLSPKGKILLTCPHFYNLHEEPYDFWRATPYAIQHFAQKYGFEVIHFEKAGDAWDVLGTLLGSFGIAPRSSSLVNKFIYFSVVSLRKIVYKLLSTGIIQKRLSTNGGIYLSNIAVLSKV
jgi:SAM-dependent methyltransferase